MASPEALTEELIGEVRRHDLSDITITRDLLQRGADINGRSYERYGRTPLILGAMEGGESVKIIVELLKHENLDVNAIDEIGLTALIMACTFGKQEVVRILLKDDRVDVNAENKLGWTTFLASALGQQEVVDMLLKDDRVDVNAKTNFGCTALIWASRDGYSRSCPHVTEGQ